MWKAYLSLSFPKTIKFLELKLWPFKNDLFNAGSLKYILYTVHYTIMAIQKYIII